ncbi:25136_t:CDS:2, partial [Gigaspora rosea]
MMTTKNYFFLFWTLESYIDIFLLILLRIKIKRLIDSKKVRDLDSDVIGMHDSKQAEKIWTNMVTNINELGALFELINGPNREEAHDRFYFCLEEIKDNINADKEARNHARRLIDIKKVRDLDGDMIGMEEHHSCALAKLGVD